MEKIGLIAGSDELPLVFAAGAAKANKAVVAIAFKGYTSREIEALARTYWLDGVNVGEVLEILNKEDIKSVVMEGKIPHSIVLSEESVDSGTMAVLDHVRDFQTQTILGRAASFLETLGITVMDARTHLEPVLCPRGNLTARAPSENEQREIEFGIEILNTLGPADIGQLVAVKNRVVLAVEAIEGTDEAIKRGAELGGEGVVIVKMAKPNQDMRFDLPVIGERTIKIMSDYGVKAIAVESGKTVILNREKVIKLADADGIALIGV